MLNIPLFNTSFAIPAASPATPPVTLCPSGVPLVLLPVRLETRFFTLQSGVTELRVRVYPDKIHLDSHQPELSTDERAWGARYWQQDWSAGSNQTARADAWRTIADRFGAARAAWVARTLTPTNLAQRSPSVAPVLPTLPPVGPAGEDAWRTAPQARLMPDRWTAVVHSGGHAVLQVTGLDITRPLAVGPDPQRAPLDAATEAAIAAGDALAVDPGMKWMIDFDAAESAGMALRIAIPPSVLAAGLDSLVVFGVAGSLGAANSGAQLADLLDAHHYTDGLEFLRLGAPTNNTDDRRAAYSSEDPAHARSFANEMANPAVASGNALNAGVALGVPAGRIAGTLGTIGEATTDSALDMRSMNTALWQVGWGYYLSNMMGPETGLTPDAVDWARARFLNSVRAGGPFPVLRCGRQPYGVLPVTSLDLWAPDANDGNAARGAWLKGLLLNMRDQVWRPVAGGVARVGRRAPSLADADLADVMQTDAISNSYRTRAVLGRHYVEHLFALNAQDFSGQAVTQATIAGRLLQLLGLPTAAAQLPRLGHAFYDNAAWNVTAPLVQSGEVSPWRMLEPNYIGALLATPSIQTIIDTHPLPTSTDGTTSLLQSLLRHAMLREIATAAARIAANLPGNSLAVLLRDVELVDLVNQPPVSNVFQEPAKNLLWRRQLDLTVPAITGANTIRQFIEALADFSAPTVASLGQFRTALTHLQTLDSETLAFLAQGTLDLSTHRLDAWITSYATERLTAMTANGSAGQFVGGYGWVENLRPAATPSTIPTTSLPPGESGPLVALPQDSGFIHAPSLTHASTAALLRNAHLGATGIPQANGPFAIDLSSRRVRESARILEGVRQGQPLGALLGYRFERRLHDLKLDRFIARLRALAPLVVRARDAAIASPAAPSLESVGANNVVDGLVLLRRWQEETAIVQATVNGPAGIPADPGAAAVVIELNALADSVDGLSDALTAEAAYQMVRGNTSRMGSTLLSIAQGDAPPPELEVARTPRTGNSITHRVMVLFSGAPPAVAGWPDAGASARASVERTLEAWTSTLLGDSRAIRCTVERVDDAGSVIATQAFPVSELSVAALDFVYNVDATTRGGSPSYMEQWVLYQARRREGGFGNATNLRVQHSRPTDLAAGETTLFDALEQARAIRKLLDGARGAYGEDLSAPDQPAAGTIDVADLEARVIQVESALKTAHQTLVALIGSGANTPSDSFRGAMLALGALGVTVAVPSVAVGDDPGSRALLLQQAAAIAKVSGARVDQSAALAAQPVATEPQARNAQLLERARAALGVRFVLLPKITCTAAAATELNGALGASGAQLGGDALAPYTWFARYGRVRDPLARLSACLRNAEVLAAGERINLAVAQLPFDASERWVGLPRGTDGKDVPTSRLSIVAQSSAPVDATATLSGLFVDEWVELVPNAKETTGLAFQFDPPDSVAPQNILVAVPPIPGQDWTTETVRRVLMETLDLAKLRGVDASLLGAASQYLPALYVPFNIADDAVSTNFATLTR
ncbi:MAG: hypothetical protein ABJF01_10050 [bacterium]